MQKFIDIVIQWVKDQAYATQAWVLAKGYLTTSCVYRGDPAAWDYQDAQFTTDGAWHTLDLSAIVPAGAKAITFWCFINDGAINSFIQFKSFGQANNLNSAQVRIQVANIIHSLDAVISLDADRKIQYRTTNTPFTNIRFTVKGWWL